MTENTFDSFFQSQDLEIMIFPENSKKVFTDFDLLYTFIENEVNFWNFKDLNNLSYWKSSPFINVYNHFNKIFNNLKNSKSNFDRNPDASKSQLISAIDMLNRTASPRCIYSITKMGKLLKQFYQESILKAEGAIQYLLDDSLHKLNGKPYLEGVLIAYDYLNQTNKKSQRFSIEKESLEDLRKNYHSEFSVLQKKYKNEHIILKEKIENFINRQEQWQNKTQNDLIKFIDNKKNTLEKIEKEKTESLTSLELLYKEKLRLDGPAKYWKKFRDRYRIGGIIWLLLSFVIGSAIIIVTLHLLSNMPDKLFSNTDKLSIENTIKWTILLALIFTTLFYLLRITIKLSLSAFHLSRDANERLQLTHQYLALIKENVIDEKHREIILTSLFSRAETGLLKGESSPAFPDSILTTILKNIKS